MPLFLMIWLIPLFSILAGTVTHQQVAIAAPYSFLWRQRTSLVVGLGRVRLAAVDTLDRTLRHEHSVSSCIGLIGTT